MFRQVKHDRKQSKRVKKQTFTIVSCRGDQWSPALSLIKRTTSVIPSEVEESRGNEFFLIPRGGVFLLFRHTATRVRWCRKNMRLRLDVSTTLNMTGKKKKMVSFRAKSRNLVETNAEACSLLFRCPRRAGCKRKKTFMYEKKRRF